MSYKDQNGHLKESGSFLLYFVMKDLGKFLGLTFLGLLWAFSEVLGPFFLKKMIDTATTLIPPLSFGYVMQAISYPLICFLTVRIIIETALRARGFLLARVAPSFRRRAQLALFSYLMGHSHSYFLNHFAGSLASKVTAVSKSALRLIMMIFLDFIPLFLSLALALCFLWQVHAYFAALLVFWGVLYLTLVWFLFKNKLMVYATDLSKVEGEVQGRIVDAITNMINVRLFARNRFEKKSLKKTQKKEALARSKMLIAGEGMRTFQAVASIVLLAGNLMLLVWGLSLSWVTVGDLALVINLSFSVLWMCWVIAEQMLEWVEDLGVVKEGLRALIVPHDILDQPNAPSLKVCRGQIHFERITFSYSGQKPLFNEFDLTIEKQEKVGLVGCSGAGKTTLINLLLRHFELQKGRILIDGQDINIVSQESLRQNLALIPQDISLFHRSLMDNIRYGRLEASDEEVTDAAKKAYCHEFIMKMSHGYQTLVGERGVKLSGGQRQRIAIARAFLKQAPIILLDEATSALDSQTEHDIQMSMEELMKERTVLTIAHRLSTLLNMDRILLFEEGHLIEEGTHRELIKKQGAYARLWQIQAGQDSLVASVSIS